MKPLLLVLGALLAAALGAAVLAFLWLTPASVAPTGAEPEAAPRARGASDAASDLHSAEPPSEASGESRQVAAPSELPATEDTAREAARAILGGRVVDERGLALAGVQVRLEDPSGRSLGLLEAQAGRTESDGTGLFRIELPLAAKAQGLSRRLVAHLEGFARLQRDVELAVGEQWLGDLVLPSAGEVRGVVLDEHGRPLASARVIAFGSGQRGFGDELSPPGTTDAETVSDGDGRFRLEAVPVGVRFVGAGAEGRLWSYTDALEVRARDVLDDVELRLEPIPEERRISLIVLDPEGEPVPRARVDWRYALPMRGGSGGGRADANGRYEMLLDVVAPYSFVVSDTEARFRPASLEDVAPGTRDLEVRLGELRALTLVVSDETGHPLQTYRAQAVHTEDGAVLRYLGRLRSEPPFPTGRAELVLPAEPFSVRVEADGFDVALLGPFDPDAAPEVLEVVLARLPGVHGTVVSDGKPLAGARVSLHEAPEGILTVNGFQARYNLHAEGSDVTDAEGRFDLTLRSRGRFWLRAEADGLAPADLGPLELEPSVGREGLELALGRGGAIEGRVIVPLDGEALGTVVGASRADGHAVTQRADSQGRYRFEGLTPGAWLIARADEEISSAYTTTSLSGEDPQEPRSNCVVREGQTTRFDLDLTRGPPVVLAGRLTLSGAPARGWRAKLSSSPGAAGRHAELDADGRFELTSEAAGPHELDLEPQEGAAWSATLSAKLDLPEGTTPWEVDLPVGSLGGRIGSAGSPTGLATWSEGALRFQATFEIAPDGTYALALLPAGEVLLRRLEEGAIVELGRAQIVAGQASTLDLP